MKAWIADLTASGLAPATVHKAYQTLSKVMRAAVDGDLIAQSPCRNVALPRIERQEMRFLTPAEILTLADAIPARYRAMVVFDAYCGLRMGELAGLRCGRVDLLRRQVRVIETAVEVKGQLLFNAPKTSAGNRTVPVPASIASVLAEHLGRFSGGGPNDLVFPGPDGGALRVNAWRARYWQPAVSATSLAPLRPHDLRHTAVSLWIADGASPKQIATWAGAHLGRARPRPLRAPPPGHEEGVLAALDGFAKAPPEPAGDLLALPVPEDPRDFRGVNRLRAAKSESPMPSDLRLSVGDEGLDPPTSAV